MLNVLFVCLGNICRSPLAEAVFDQIVKEEGLSNHFKSDSCGTGGYHIGADPDPRSQEIARIKGVPMEHKARKFSPKDYENFDYIIPMDQANYHDIVAVTGEKHPGLYLMRAFDEEAGSDEDVPDPYYGGSEGFRNVYNMLERSNRKFIAFLKEKHRL
ncbi:MAG: low molecular weight protein-tyrosine-phosphatase [Bacteroidota bacterium]